MHPKQILAVARRESPHGRRDFTPLCAEVDKTGGYLSVMRMRDWITGEVRKSTANKTFATFLK